MGDVIKSSDDVASFKQWRLAAAMFYAVTILILVATAALWQFVHPANEAQIDSLRQPAIAED